METTKEQEIRKPELFEHEEFGCVRILQEGDAFFFCGRDVAKALGYGNPAKAIRMHCRQDGGPKRTPIQDALGRTQEAVFIPEGDVYRLIIHSRLPAAERFERWMFDEVLPSIRKHGAYMTDTLLAQVVQEPETVYLLAETLLRERRRGEQLEAELGTARPKAAYYDAFVDPSDCTNLRTTAKELQVPERWFARVLQETGFLYRAPSGELMPYNKPSNKGLFIVRDFCRNGHKGAYTLITPRGKDFFRMITVRNGFPE